MSMSSIYKEKGMYRLRGVGISGDVDRIQLFDGSFDTGFVLKSIAITPANPAQSEEVWLRVLLNEATHTTNWDWSDPNEVAWGAWGIPINSRFGYFFDVDPDVIIVEDMYLDFSGDAGQRINYMIEMEKVKMSTWEGGFQIAKNNKGA